MPAATITACTFPAQAAAFKAVAEQAGWSVTESWHTRPCWHVSLIARPPQPVPDCYVDVKVRGEWMTSRANAGRILYTAWTYVGTPAKPKPRLALDGYEFLRVVTDWWANDQVVHTWEALETHVRRQSHADG